MARKKTKTEIFKNGAYKKYIKQSKCLCNNAENDVFETILMGHKKIWLGRRPCALQSINRWTYKCPYYTVPHIRN